MVLSEKDIRIAMEDVATEWHEGKFFRQSLVQ